MQRIRLSFGQSIKRLYCSIAALAILVSGCFPDPEILDRLDGSGSPQDLGTPSFPDLVAGEGGEDGDRVDVSTFLDVTGAPDDGHLGVDSSPDIQSPLDVFESHDIVDDTSDFEDVTDTSCTPSCPTNSCGDDGCGGQCGVCVRGFACADSRCVGIRDVSAGADHTCLITTNRQTWCLGSSERSIVPLGASVKGQPVRIASLPAVDRIVSGAHLACVWAQNSQLYCWGANDRGQILFFPGADISIPSAVPGFDNVSMFASGGLHSCAKNDLSFKCWGANSFGQLSAGERLEYEGPVFATFPAPNLASLALGSFHSCAVYSNATPQCVGANGTAQLGDGTTTPRSQPQSMAGSIIFRQVSAGSIHGCGRDGEGLVYCWGDNFFGAVGDGTFDRRRSPVAVSLPSFALGVVASEGFSCAWLLDGKTYCWGDNRFGQLGDGSTNDSPSPVRVLTNESFERVVVGTDHACGLTSDGRLFCWGRNRSGQTGNPSEDDVLRPTLVEFSSP